MRAYLRILTYLKSYWRHLVGSILCTLLFALFSGAMLWMVAPFLKTIFSAQQEAPAMVSPPSQPSSGFQSEIPFLTEMRTRVKVGVDDLIQGQTKLQTLERLCLLILIIVFFKNLFQYLQRYLMAYVEQGVIRDLRNQLYQHLHRLSLSYFHQKKTGQLISRITYDVSLVNSGVTAGFVGLVKNPALLVCYFFIILMISWRLTLFTMAVVPVTLLVITKLGRKLHRYSAVSQEKMAELTSTVQEAISGMRVVRAFATERFETEKFARRMEEYFRTMLRLLRIRFLSTPLNELLGMAIGVLLLWYGGKEVLRGHSIAPEDFFLFLVVLFSMLEPIKALASTYGNIQEGLAAAKRIFQVLDTPPTVTECEGAITIREFKEAIRFRNVSFSYDGGVPVLNNIDAEIKKGRVIALVGPSGGGKSTFVDLVARFYDPTEGVIEIDGIDLRRIKLDSLRRLMGIVTQETILFHDTVRDNIAYGLDGVPGEEVITAARLANAHQFISHLPQGYQTMIGDRGVKLSGGERQRLAIARALLRNPPILIFDEATSSLDTESEVLVQEAIERVMEGRTAIVIAHRLSTVQRADEILVIDGGRIVQRGRHEDLLHQEGLYKKLYQMQFRDEQSG